MSVYAKLMKARLRLQGEKLAKSGHNKFAGYTYFELADFLPTVQRIFSDLGLCGIVSYTKDEARLTITDIEAGGTEPRSIEITSPMGSAALKGCHEVQNIGAVETYQRRYLWVTAMEIVEHDVLDATTAKDAPKSAKSITKHEWDELSPERQKELQNIADCVRAELDAKGGPAAKALLESECADFDENETVAIWSRFDPKEREAISPKRKAA